MKAAGAVYRNTLAWSLQERLGIRMEQYGKDGEFTRVAGMPEDLIGHWSKRRAAIIEAAREMGFTVEGNAPRAAAANKITRAGKSPDNYPEIRHRRWRGEAEGYVEREELIASLLGKAEEITQEQIPGADGSPGRPAVPSYTRGSGVPPAGYRRAGGQRHRRLVEPGRGGNKYRTRASKPGGGAPDPPAAFGRGPGRYGSHEAVFDPSQPAYGAGSQEYGGRHGRRYGPFPVRPGYRGKGCGVAEGGLSAERGTDHGDPLGHLIPGAGSPSSKGRRGSGKTTTLRPIADLYREHGTRALSPRPWPGERLWRLATMSMRDRSVSTSCCALPLGVGSDIDGDTTIIVDEAGMLSTRQAHHILQLSERHGAKIVFAGDTQQQQPVEAGPGLRLIRDAVGSVRVDRIRRQKAGPGGYPGSYPW